MALCLKKPAAKARVEYSRCYYLNFKSCQAARVQREEDDPAEALAAKRRKARASAVFFPEKDIRFRPPFVRSTPWNNAWSEPQLAWLQLLFVFCWQSSMLTWSGL